MPICSECGKKAGGFSLRGFNELTGRCDHCDVEAEKSTLRALERFRVRFNELIRMNALTEEGWARLEAIAFENGIEPSKVVAHLRKDLQDVFEQALSDRTDGDSSDDLSYLTRALLLPEHFVEEAKAFVDARKTAAVSCVRCGAGVSGRRTSYDYKCAACGTQAVMAQCDKCSAAIQIAQEFFGKYFACFVCGQVHSWGTWNDSRITIGAMAEALNEEPRIVEDPARRKTYGLYLGGSGYQIELGYSVLLDFTTDDVVLRRYKQGHRAEIIGRARYTDVTSLQIGGRGVITSGGGWVGGGFGVKGIVSGVLLASALNQMTRRSSIKTVVYFKTTAGELILFNNHFTPEHLRIMLSPAFTRIENAQRQNTVASATIVDQLRQLGELRAAGTISQDEFQLLKEKLIKST